MRHIKKSSLIITAVLVVILGIVGQNIIGNYYYSPASNLNSQPGQSTVYIENGVTGTVAITDPFMNRTMDIDVLYDPLDSGSGFIVNSNGYIVTAFHVVGDPQSLITQNTLRQMNSNDIHNYIERAAVSAYITNYNPQLGSEIINNNTPGNPMVIEAQPDANTTTDIMNQKNLLNVKSSQQLIKVKLPGTSSSSSMNANLVDVGNSGTDDDVAVLKVDTLFQKLQPLTINSKRPGIGDKIQIYGYPVVDSSMYSQNNPAIIKPSSTTGVLTSVVPNNGTTYFETDAVTAHGYSGGPVTDSQNSVLGIIIYSLETNQQINQQNGSTSSLFLSSDYIIQICNKNNIPINVV
jgi:S1-C subfamily serine protease